MRLNKIASRFNYPLEIYKGNTRLKKTLEDVVSTFKIFIKHWKLFKPIRACIEHFFQINEKRSRLHYLSHVY